MVLIMQIIFALRISSNGLKNKTMKIIYTSILALTLISCGTDNSTEVSESNSEKYEAIDNAGRLTFEKNTELPPITEDKQSDNAEQDTLVSLPNITVTGEGVKPEANKVMSDKAANSDATKVKPSEDVNVTLNDAVADAKLVISDDDSGPKTDETINSPMMETKIDHLAWDALVRKNVGSNGKVSYKGFKSSATELNNYLAELSKEAPGSDWSKNEKLAFWINAYNAFTVKLIVDNYPLKSITDLSKPWDTKNINIAGKMYSLGGIENDILRKMNEPRIHFAINCASVSCPNLLNKAFLADKMSSQLALVTNSFFADGTKNDFSSKTIKISKLFDWYSVDFAKGDVIKYINSNRTEQLSDKTKISYLEYDWSLNE
jgi:hypothetical protein